MIFAILSALTGLLPSFLDIGKQIAAYKTAKLNAETDKEKAYITAELSALQARRDVLVAMAGNRAVAILNASAAFLLALGPILYTLKYYGWDKVIGSFRGCAGEGTRDLLHCATHKTDGLNPEMAAVLTAAVGFYLLYSVFKK